MFVENSGHMQFADPVAVKQMGLNLMCLIGSAESEVSFLFVTQRKKERFLGDHG